MRGLKQKSDVELVKGKESHLLQMRGLKLPVVDRVTGSGKSHLLQMRGLKLALVPRSVKKLPVASFTDAWIETS